MIPIKATAAGLGDVDASKEPFMPSTAVPFIVAVCAAFSFFVLVIGGVSVWTSLPDRKKPE